LAVQDGLQPLHLRGQRVPFQRQAADGFEGVNVFHVSVSFPVFQNARESAYGAAWGVFSGLGGTD
jgi:hypothetical protein